MLRNIKSEHKISNLVITTNGYKLNEIAEELIGTGINGINISIDSLDRKEVLLEKGVLPDEQGREVPAWLGSTEVFCQLNAP